MRMIGLAVALGVVLALPAAGITLTDLGPPAIVVNEASPSLDELGCAGGPVLTTCSGQDLATEEFSLQSWSFEFSQSERSIDVFVELVNDTDATHSYQLSVLLPILPFGPPIVIQGSVLMNLTETKGGFATLTDDGKDIYSVLVDGLAVASRLDPPIIFTAGPFQTTGFFFSRINPTALDQMANTSMGIRIEAVLSPGALGRFEASFDVIPEPATALLLLAGLAGLAGIHGSGVRSS